ncbi:MAG: hypothetical protein KDC80_05150 [Saprospiraceae bacterium]|nr:hypothetical protein [Saprospiraceae bacterium]
MKKEFIDRLSAIQWIADFAQSEMEFEILREELNFNYIYNEQYFILARHLDGEVVSR